MPTPSYYPVCSTEIIHAIKRTRPPPSIFEDCERSKTGQWQRPRNEANEHAKLPLPLKILFSKCKCVEEEWVSFISETYQQLLEKDTTVTDSTTSSGCVLVSILNKELPSHCFEEFYLVLIQTVISTYVWGLKL